jgi:diguanylate cyclase (GGDEF)-like protein
MSNEATHNPSIEAPTPSWDAQDVPARRATLTRILVRIAREALQRNSLGSILHGICVCLVDALPVSLASVILLDEANTEFIQEVYAGEITHSPLKATGQWPVSQGAAGRCVRLGVPQLIADVTSDPDYIPGNVWARAEYLVPIRHGTRLHGVLNLESARTDFFDDEALAVFNAVADLVAGAIHFARMADELQSANRKLEQLSMIDGLTGIANRRRFDQQLQADWARLARERRPLALLIADADAFKPLNDACGHLYGDECLRELARICGTFAGSPGQLVARFGGEEIVLLLPGCDLEGAVAIAEAMRAAVQAAALPHPDSPAAAHVTISVGVAAVLPEASGAPELLIANADRALYAAKAQGRNRVAAMPGA